MDSLAPLLLMVVYMLWFSFHSFDYSFVRLTCIAFFCSQIVIKVDICLYMIGFYLVQGKHLSFSIIDLKWSSSRESHVRWIWLLKIIYRIGKKIVIVFRLKSLRICKTYLDNIQNSLNFTFTLNLQPSKICKFHFHF